MSSRCVVTIAGSDPSGGAGIQADIKTISATGSYAASIITALTAQNTQGVQGIHGIPPDFIAQQMQSVFSDLPVQAVKIGMLHAKDIIDVVAHQLTQLKPPKIVLDPVMIAKGGQALLKPDLIHHLQQTLFPLATLITPNLPEAESFLSQAIHDQAEMEKAAIQLGTDFSTNVLIKGGHLAQSASSDVLYLHSEKTCHWFHSDHVETKNTHGTGCTLSSAIASFLAQEHSLVHAIDKAKCYLFDAIIHGQSLQLGKGHGPVNHFYFL